MRIVFMGTPAFAVPTLEALEKSSHEVVGVVTAPDAPAGRGLQLRFSAVKVWAHEKGVLCLQPQDLQEPHFIAQLQRLKADVFVVVAFRMLPRAVFAIPHKGTINLHASLLPKYRGAAPIAWAIMAGETQTGLTTFCIDDTMDTGAILLQDTVSIAAEDTAKSLQERMQHVGAALMLRTLEGLTAGTLSAQRQEIAPGQVLPKAPKLTLEHGRLNWNTCARDLINQVRGLYPWPGAWADMLGVRCKILRLYMPFEDCSWPTDIAVGTFWWDKKNLWVRAKDGFVGIAEIQPAAKKPMSAAAFWRGYGHRMPLQGLQEM